MDTEEGESGKDSDNVCSRCKGKVEGEWDRVVWGVGKGGRDWRTDNRDSINQYHERKGNIGRMGGGKKAE